VDTTTIRQLTRNSNKVYFLDFYSDFYYYYYGGYAPQGYYNPCGTWVFKKDLRSFLQDLLNDHYYVVFDAAKFASFEEYVAFLEYNRSTEKSGLIAISKEASPYAFSKTADELYHVAIKDSSSNNGIEHAGLVIKGNFTIEALIRPASNSLPNATILNNWEDFNGLSGITLQKNGSLADQYIFGFGYSSMQNIIFTLGSNQWHYLAVAVSDGDVKVFDWGKQIAQGAINTPMPNSNAPMVIGNGKNRDRHFDGFIREVKISTGINESGILETAARLSKQLNDGSF
jgi:concanavalin A-like lectin/glucanase superfamily protein